MLWQKLLGANGAPTSPPERAIFLGAAALANNASSYTFSGVDFGPAGDRTIVVVAYSHGTGTATCTSISIAGTNGNLFAGALSNITQGIASRLVTSGTSGTVVATFSGLRSGGCAIAVYALYGLASSVRTGAAQSAISSLSASGSVPTSGPGHILIASLGTGADAYSGMSFTGVALDGQALLVSPRTLFAASNESSIGSSNTVSASWSGAANARLMVTSYN